MRYDARESDRMERKVWDHWHWKLFGASKNIKIIDTIHSTFQLETEEMKVKVKSFIESSKGKVSITLFDFCIESNTDTSKNLGFRVKP